MRALQAFLRQLEGALPPAHAARILEREAEQLGITRAEWSSLRAMKIDLVMVREAHRFASTRASVRRAGRDGEWALASAQAGKLRSQPQSFRVGDRIEPAWDHATLKQRLAELVNATRDATASTPIAAITTLVRGFVRAQPFLGENERTALIVASLLLRSVGLPALSVLRLEHDRSFLAALIANDDAAMLHALTDAVWSEALGHIEALAIDTTTARTLAAEHAALAAARELVRPITDVELASHADIVASTIEAYLATRFALGPSRRLTHTTFAARAQAASVAVYRQHIISAQHTLIEVRWSLDPQLEVVLVIAHAGRGIAGALSAHLALEHPTVPTARRAPALLLIPDEPAAELASRLEAWVGPALDVARRDAPLSIASKHDRTA